MIEQLSAETACTRQGQLNALANLCMQDMMIFVHGSIGHAVAMGDALPSHIKMNGEARDIDVFAQGTTTKYAVEHWAAAQELNIPAPIDAGMNGLLIIDDSGTVAAHKNGIEVELDDSEGVFIESALYELVEGDGIQVRSFSPAGLLAAHTLEPRRHRINHLLPDRRFRQWCLKDGVRLPDRLTSSISDFHRAYRAAYPFGVMLDSSADVYASTLPDSVRRHFRGISSKVMLKHAGRRDRSVND